MSNTDDLKNLENAIRGHGHEVHHSPRPPRRELARDLPASVVALSNQMHDAFKIAADKCYYNADSLRTIANNLDARGNKLMEASPKVRGDMEDWIAFEIETQKTMDMLRVIIKKAEPASDVN